MASTRTPRYLVVTRLYSLLSFLVMLLLWQVTVCSRTKLRQLLPLTCCKQTGM